MESSGSLTLFCLPMWLSLCLSAVLWTKHGDFLLFKESELPSTSHDWSQMRWWICLKHQQCCTQPKHRDSRGHTICCDDMLLLACRKKTANGFFLFCHLAVHSTTQSTLHYFPFTPSHVCPYSDELTAGHHLPITSNSGWSDCILMCGSVWGWLENSPRSKSTEVMINHWLQAVWPLAPWLTRLEAASRKAWIVSCCLMSANTALLVACKANWADIDYRVHFSVPIEDLWIHYSRNVSVIGHSGCLCPIRRSSICLMVIVFECILKPRLSSH